MKKNKKGFFFMQHHVYPVNKAFSAGLIFTIALY